jgi:hypothetical protein
MYDHIPIQIGQMEFTDLMDVIVWVCQCQGIAVVECLVWITGYAWLINQKVNFALLRDYTRDVAFPQRFLRFT